MTSSHAAAWFLLFAAITQWPVVEKIVRLPFGAAIGATKSHLNGSFSDRKTGSRSGSSWRNATRPALKSATPSSREYWPTGGAAFCLRKRSTSAWSAWALPGFVNVTAFPSGEMMSTPQLWMLWYWKYQLKSLFVIGT